MIGLKKLVQEGENVELFADDLLKRSGTWSMSTSQIYIRNAPSYGWGPVVKEGYGREFLFFLSVLGFGGWRLLRKVLIYVFVAFGLVTVPYMIRLSPFFLLLYSDVELIQYACEQILNVFSSPSLATRTCRDKR